MSEPDPPKIEPGRGRLIYDRARDMIVSFEAPPVFEFTYDNRLFQIFEDGRVNALASPYPPEAKIVINRLKRR